MFDFKTVKMIVTDLDSTLLRSDKTISEYTQEVFERLHEQNILVAFATSRAMRASERFREIIKPNIDITSGGAIAVMGGAIAVMGGKTLFRAAIDIDIANSIIHDLRTNNEVLQITVDSEEYYFSSKPSDKSWLGWEDYNNAVVTDFVEPLSVNDVLKISPHVTNAETLSEIISHYPTVDIISFTGEDWYQIKSKKAAKDYALAEVCKQLDISMSEVVAFGDDYNDISMIRECGVGVAVANAIDEVKAVANYFCDTNDNDGVAKWIEENIL